MGSRQVEHFDVAEVESSSSGEDEEYLGLRWGRRVRDFWWFLAYFEALKKRDVTWCNHGKLGFSQIGEEWIWVCLKRILSSKSQVLRDVAGRVCMFFSDSRAYFNIKLLWWWLLQVASIPHPFVDASWWRAKPLSIWLNPILLIRYQQYLLFAKNGQNTNPHYLLEKRNLRCCCCLDKNPVSASQIKHLADIFSHQKNMFQKKNRVSAGFMVFTIQTRGELPLFPHRPRPF